MDTLENDLTALTGGLNLDDDDDDLGSPYPDRSSRRHRDDGRGGDG